jgi:hypothetical protein
MTTGRGHAPYVALVDLVEQSMGRGTGDGVGREWADHVASCEVCRERMREIEGVLSGIEECDVGDAPDTWVHRAEMLAVPRSFMGPLRGDFTAQVIFDSAAQLRVGSRSSGLDSRQFVLASNRIETEITIAPEGAEDGGSVSGQVFVLEGEQVELRGCRVTLLERGEERGHALLDSAGDFLIAGRTGGPFQLRIDGVDWSVTTPPLTL